MAEIDRFASLLLEEAKRFFERAAEAKDKEARSAYSHAALMVGFASLEAHVNAVAEEVSERKGVSLHERAVLMEREMRLEEGAFIEKALRMYRLEDRLYLLHRRFGKRTFDKAAVMASSMGNAIVLRNKLTHPKGETKIALKEVKSALEAIVETIDSLYKAIFGKGLPAAARGLHSNLTF